MTKDCQKMKKATISYKTHHKIDGKFQDSVWIRSLKFLVSDPVCPERLDPDPVNIRTDPQPCACTW